MQQISQRNNDDHNKLFGDVDRSNIGALAQNQGHFEDDDLLADEKSAGFREEHIQDDIDYGDGFDNSEDEVDGEDLLENMEQDYRRQDELDQYEDVGIDDDQQDELSMNQRMQVDQRLD